MSASGSPLLEVRDLVKDYPVRRGFWQRRVGAVHALAGVDLTVERGRCVALVGESGSGKSTLARCVMRLEHPTSGGIRLAGEDLLALRGEALRRRRRAFQMVFQDPHASLNPRLRLGTAIGEPLAVHGLASRAERALRVTELLGLVGLPTEVAGRYPGELSGGQRQRVCIARALAPGPQLLVADEPVSALDVSVRAQILNLLLDLQERLGLGLLLISHDLAVVERIAETVYVLYLGRVVEQGPVERVIAAAHHPYTVSLLAAVPSAVPPALGGPEAVRLRLGEPPSPRAPPTGCPFHPRCPIARAQCAERAPQLGLVAPGHLVACHYPGEMRRDDSLPVPGL